VDTADGMINLGSLTALTTEKLHVLYVIGISVHRRGNMAVIMVGKVL
jgi:hypothetical protein